jgi:hypothetical protein
VFARGERDGLLGGVEEGDDERVVELDCDVRGLLLGYGWMGGE